MGFTKEYAAPEAVMYYPEDHSGRRVTLSPPMDVYAVALIALQMLFVQERPRTDAQVGRGPCIYCCWLAKILLPVRRTFFFFWQMLR